MKIALLVLCFLASSHGQSITLVNYNVSLGLVAGENSTQIILSLADEVKITGQIGVGKNVQIPEECDQSARCEIQTDDFSFVADSIDSGFILTWQTNNIESVFQDCLDLNSSDTHWYGGPERWTMNWPIENDHFRNRVYTPLKTDNGAVAERYWLNSKGGFVWVADKVPLFLDQNNKINGSICFSAAATGDYSGREKVVLKYYLMAKPNPKEGHLDAVNFFLGKPKSHPADWVIRHPIWTTWAKYKTNISDQIVTEFAEDIANHGFTGQIEIDDYWETCYGSLVFNDDQFSNISSTVQTLKDSGFTVTLWTHPFVNADCTEAAKFGEDNGYFVKSSDGSDQVSWWDGDDARHIDFTKEGARKWFTDRLKTLQELHGLDSFKFDAGEADWVPKNPVLNADIEDSPNAITAAYVRTCAEFGGLLEVRTGWRTQDLGVLVRMLDKDSRWTLNNGLHSIITSLLQFNMNGYVFVLPDMIGGNGYLEQPTAELIVRWTQANTFMPTMQFSYLPWEVTTDEFDSLAIVQKFVSLHANYSDAILEAMNKSITDGTPVNPPIWWVDPTNPDALKSNDQFLLGEGILVAPVVEEGARSRNVVIPAGSWVDGNDGTVYEGPQILTDYPAPIDVLPYFIKQ